MRMKLAGRVSAIVVSLVASTAALAAGESPAPSAANRIKLGTTTYTQNFDTLANSGTGPFTSLPAGWRIFEGTNGSAADGAYVVGTGGTNPGNVYSYGAAGSTDRALGSLTSGNEDPAIYGAYFTNTTGVTITSLAVSYFGEQWRKGTATDDALSFSYMLGAATSLNTGTWTTVSALGFTSPRSGTNNSGTDGNTIRTAISSTISGLSIAAGSSFTLRWVDRDVGLNDDGLAIDDFSITANPAAAAVPEAATWVMMVAGFGLLGASLRRRRAGVFA